jgi:hypothetical protein
MRQSLDKEIATRANVLQFIKERAVQTSKVVYYSPSRVKSLLERDGVFVSVDYVMRRYAEMGVKNNNGIWCKDLK